MPRALRFACSAPVTVAGPARDRVASRECDGLHAGKEVDDKVLAEVAAHVPKEGDLIELVGVQV